MKNSVSINNLTAAMVLLLMCTSYFAQAQGQRKAKANKEEVMRPSIAAEVPLIDREIFFDNPEIEAGQISPDGNWITFLKPFKNELNIWIKKFDDSFDAAYPITADTLRPIRNYWWTRDSKYVLYVQDKGGNENFLVYSVNPNSPVGSGGVPESRNLTNIEDVRVYIYHIFRSNPDVLMIGLNDRDKAWHDLYQLTISTGELKLIRENTDRITGWDFDWDDKVRLARRSRVDGYTEILRVDNNELVNIYECSPLETCYASTFDADNQNLYMVTNKGDENNLTKLVLFNPNTMEEELVEIDPEDKVDFGGARISDVTRKIVMTTYTDAKTRRYFKDKEFENDYKFLQSKFPNSEINFSSSDLTERKYFINVWSDTDPSSTYIFDRDTREVVFQYRPRPKLKEEYLSPMNAISYKSSDGLEIPGYLTIPKGKEAKNLPLLVVPHGGPWARDYWGFNSFAQFWSNRGYAVLQMNFRGSSGYGKAFLNAGNKQWGEKMQDDITWGVKYLIEKGIADPERVGILGGSYGGYATLAGVTFTPDLYKAAVAVVAPSNINTLVNSVPPYWESMRQMFKLRVGDIDSPEGKKQLERQSPLNYVERIKTPLMIAHGANDPRVKKSEADQIVVAMREKNIPVEYICAPDEGHGFARPINRSAYFAAAEKFLALHLGGRYQESMKPDVEKRLAEITVDIATVEKPVVAVEGEW
jgi:dipeptidyl aminopeptidase/acylaminoacyl peptidase